MEPHRYGKVIRLSPGDLVTCRPHGHTRSVEDLTGEPAIVEIDGYRHWRWPCGEDGEFIMPVLVTTAREDATHLLD
ncbi:hypothetical protein ACLQ26_20220 [Micromonospora sp. DT43]|uniref:hypothetical protein n=1 Tax=Micromonospora sp. DT43 TaxID=3393440 RepID=UPI003CE71CA0